MKTPEQVKKQKTKGSGSDYLDNYETVKERKRRFRDDYPNGIVLPFHLSPIAEAQQWIEVVAFLWRDKKIFEDLKPEILVQALEILKDQYSSANSLMLISALLKVDSIGHSLSIAGTGFADKNAWVENCEESAIGRALDNFGYHTGSCSREEMEKVAAMEKSSKDRDAKKQGSQKDAKKEVVTEPKKESVKEEKEEVQQSPQQEVNKEPSTSGQHRAMDIMIKRIKDANFDLSTWLQEEFKVTKKEQLTYDQAVKTIEKLNKLIK